MLNALFYLPIHKALAVLLFAGYILAGCQAGGTPAQPPTPITVQLSWTHQAEFAGFYAAAQQGYFADEGLEVTFVEGGPEVDFIAPVADGAAQFGVAQPADVILARAKGKRIRSIAAIYRRSPIVFFSLAESGITRPQDFRGKTVRSATTMDLTLWAMMARLGINTDEYQTVYLPSDVPLFARGEPPVWGGFINGLALEVQRAGYEINLIFPDDYGIHFYGDVLITTDGLIAENPELVERFTRAALNGWTYAVENPGDIGAFVQAYNPQADPAAEVEKMAASIPLVNTGEDHIGWITADIWGGMEQTLRAQGIIEAPVEVSEVFTMQFLKGIYRQ